MQNQNVIMEFSETQQQFHLNYHTVKENINGFQTLQILEILTKPTLFVCFWKIFLKGKRKKYHSQK